MSRTEENRNGFAERTATMLDMGFIPWGNGGPGPESAVSGRAYSGLNALYLMERSGEKGYTDPRWVTLKDAGKHGLQVKPGGKGVALEHWSEKDGKPQVRSYHVFNAEQLSGNLPAPVALQPDYGKAAGILARAGTEIPAEQTPEAYGAALREAFGNRTKDTNMENVHTEALKQLRLNLAETFVAQAVLRETGIEIEPGTSERQSAEQPTREWSKSIRHNPVELFRATRDAAKLAEEIGKDWELNREPVPSLKLEEKKEQEKEQKAIVPQEGDRVTFHLKGSGVTLTGTVVGMDDEKGTVSLQCGNQTVPVFRGKGAFTEAAPPTREETKEYAKEQAQKHVGDRGQVFFAGADGVYKGPVVEQTATYAIQKTGPDTATLHRLKDLGVGKEAAIPEGEVVITKEAGRTTISAAEKEQEQKKTRKKAQGVER